MLRWSARRSTRRSTKANKGCADGSHPFPRNTGDDVAEGLIVNVICVDHYWNGNIKNLGIGIRI
jgi:hypothetical protein